MDRPRVKADGMRGFSRITLVCALFLVLSTWAPAQNETYYIDRGSSWSYFKGTEEPSPGDQGGWREILFADNEWDVGDAPFGYGDVGEVPYGTLLNDMEDNYSSVYLRQNFEVASPGAVASLWASYSYDDGFAMWINGVAVLSVNVSGDLDYDSFASGSHEYNIPYDVAELPDPSDYLVAGVNVVAVQFFNASISSSDTYFDIDLYDPFGPDVSPPQVAERAPAAGTTVRAIPRVEVTFNENVAGVDAGDLLVNGVPATAVTGGGAGPYIFTVTEPGPGSVQISWASGHGITDVADPPNAFAGASWTCTLDPDAPVGAITITEFLAATTSLAELRDEDDDRQDWIEIYNVGDEPANLADFSLTDDLDEPRKWRFPPVQLAAHSYKVVFASGKDRTPTSGNLHTNFQLNSSGEYLGLYRWDSPTAVIDFAPTFPPQRADHSYGLSGTGVWGYFDDPTPGEANPSGAPFKGFVAEPTASRKRGVFAGGVGNIALSTLTDGAAIRYTLDWSEPSDRRGAVYTGPISSSASARKPSVVIRAIAYKDEYLPSAVVTFTYVVLEYVIEQAQNPIDFPSTWSGAPAADYEMDPEVVNDDTELLMDALTQVPSLSIVSELDNLFGEANGIYLHPGNRGSAWERSASVELLFADSGATGFHANCGIRIQGGASRNTSKSPKHSFRLLFKGDYGPTRLLYPLFPDTPVQSFDNLVLRAGYNNSWIHWDNNQRRRCLFIRDQFARDCLRDMGETTSHGRYVHVYLNGLYWGLYNLVERPNAAFAAEHLGGGEQDYDAMNHGGLLDGYIDRWNQMYTIAGQGLATETQYQRIQEYLSVPNLIDYMIVNIYGYNDDWPGHNWYAAGRREPAGQWRFYSWDAERILEVDKLNSNKAGVSSSSKNAANLYGRLRANAEFRLLFADHLHRHFHNGGAMTPQACEDRLMARVAEIEQAVVAESARWGDYRRDVHSSSNGPYEFYRRETHWYPAQTGPKEDRYQGGLLPYYFPDRSDIVLNQFRGIDLYPDVGAPIFNKHGGTISPGFTLTMSRPSGTSGDIFYTTDGSDPRLYGSVDESETATRYTGSLLLNDPVRVRARIRSGQTWSAETDATFHIPRTLDVLRITEIMYNPADNGPIDGDEYEFIELKNTGTQVLDLSGVTILSGVLFEFPEGTILIPGGFIVIAGNSDAFAQLYPDVPIGGTYRRNLSNSGDTIELRDPLGNLILSIFYHDGNSASWLEKADGQGHSLVPVDVNGAGDLNDPANWRVSSEFRGSPGADDFSPEPSAPSFLEEPESVIVTEGEPATFSVAAQGWPTPDYQWQRDGLPISGATSLTYTLAETTLADDGAVFRCIADNSVGTAVSAEAVLGVTPRPRLFIRGDANGDATADVSDAVAMLLILFSSAGSLCDDANDANDDGALDIADPVYLLTYLFDGGPRPPAPYPECGEDATQDSLGCEVLRACK